MKIAVISLTENGRKLSETITHSLGESHSCTRYTFEKYSDSKAVAFSNLKMLIADIFNKYDALLFIAACGIAVRVIAPHIVSKTSDPAVVTVDEQGQYAISLLSGHIGGANMLTEQVAEAIGAMPVITTATDIGRKFSPDSFAVANDLYICEMEISKKIASAIVNEEKIGFYSEYDFKNIPNRFFDRHCTEIGICISSDVHKNPFNITLHLVPKNIILGIGCKKNTAINTFEKFILDKLDKYGIPVWRITEMHTIDIKKDEAAVIKFCCKYNIPLKFYTANELMSVSGNFSHSDFVMKTTGADNICERSAVIDGGKIIVSKESENGMTFAAAEKNISIDFEKKGH